MPQYQASRLTRLNSKFNEYISTDLFGGPKLIKKAWVINLQKGGTFAWVLGLMAYYDNYSTAAWVYLALHGTYGVCWLLKDAVFPDPNWEGRTTFGGALMMVALVLGPYWSFPFVLISGVGDVPAPSDRRLAAAIVLHTLGVVIMMAADAQKYFTLKIKRGLITTGMFARIRHPNYLGEMMLYGAYAVIVWHWISVAVLMWVWLNLFRTNILMKEASMSRYPEWDAYKARAGMLLPKLGVSGASRAAATGQLGASETQS